MHLDLKGYQGSGNSKSRKSSKSRKRSKQLDLGCVVMLVAHLEETEHASVGRIDLRGNALCQVSKGLIGTLLVDKVVAQFSSGTIF